MAPLSPNNGVKIRKMQPEKYLAMKMGFTIVQAGKTRLWGQRKILEPLHRRSWKNQRYSS